jgi:hypothetical protein
MLRKCKQTGRRGTHNVVLSQNAVCLGWLSRRTGHILSGYVLIICFFDNIIKIFITAY